MLVSWTLTFVEKECMYTISINQRIKRIKTFDCFDCFDFWLIKKISIYHTSTMVNVCTQSQLIKESKQSKSLIILIFWLINTSYLNKGQWSTDEDDMVLGHMAIILFPVLCKCRKISKRAKMTKIKCKDNYKIK